MKGRKPLVGLTGCVEVRFIQTFKQFSKQHLARMNIDIRVYTMFEDVNI